jgi:hypothetical protein
MLKMLKGHPEEFGLRPKAPLPPPVAACDVPPVALIDPAHRFPGAIFDGFGRSLMQDVPHLDQAALDAFPHHVLMTADSTQPLARIWVLTAGADYRAIHPVLRAEAAQLAAAGRSVLLASHFEAPVCNVRNGILDAVLLAFLPPEGRA